jgi:hypothetical protein
MPRSKKRHFAFQTFTETPTNIPSIQGFGITHQPHEGGDGAKCGAKFADTLCITISKGSGIPDQAPPLGREPDHNYNDTCLRLLRISVQYEAADYQEAHD